MNIIPITDRPVNLLVTSIAAKTSLLRELYKALKKVTCSGLIIGGDMDPNCPGRYFVDTFWQMPAITALKTDELIGYCQKHKIQAITAIATMKASASRPSPEFDHPSPPATPNTRISK